MNLEKHIESEYNRFGLIAVLILLIGCLGGITVGMGAIKDTWALILVVLPTMLTLSLLLAVAPMKWIYKAASISILIDVLLLAYYLVR
ncbi:MAG: hypothetical protein ACK5F0_05040 [Flavobacteriales bacterium]|jgi:hypothetical protein